MECMLFILNGNIVAFFSIVVLFPMKILLNYVFHVIVNKFGRLIQVIL